MGFCGGGPAPEFFEDWTEFGFAALGHRPEQHASSDAEELPPQLPGFLEVSWKEGFHFKSSAAQGFRGLLHCHARFSGYTRAAIVFEITDADCFQFNGRRPS